jgi:hypothetical protein
MQVASVQVCKFSLFTYRFLLTHSPLAYSPIQISKQVMQTRPFAGTFGATHVRLWHVDEMFAAKRLHLDAPIEAKEPFFDAGFQHQIRVTVCQ